LHCEIAFPGLAFGSWVEFGVKFSLDFSLDFMIGLVFVHGFVGSQLSFQTFPQKLSKALSKALSECNSEVIHYEYDTQGNYQRQVQKLMDFLLSTCHSVKFEKVVLLGHSMGGLLCADAYRSLYPIQKQKGWFSYQKPSLASSNEIRILLNIVGIITFDSPFYGLSTDIVGTSLFKVPELIPLLSELGIPKVSELIPGHVHVPIKGIEVPISTQWVKDKVRGFEAGTQSIPDTNTTTQSQVVSESLEISRIETETTTKTTGNWTSTAVAITAITAFARTSLATPLATAHAIKHLDTLSHYAFFLEPLTNTISQANERVDEVPLLKGFYNRVGEKTFCVVPPHDTNKFQELEMEGNELDAHMSMFDERYVGSRLDKLVSDCVFLLQGCLNI
jgi:hypothetical protein